MIKQIVIGLVIAVVGLVVSLLLAAYNSAQTAAAYSGGGGTGQHFFVPSGAVTLIGIGLVVRGLAIGTRAHYLYTGGLIHRRRSGLQSVTWPEVDDVRAIYGRDRGQVLGYRLTGPVGLSVAIPLQTDDGGRDTFLDRLIEFLRQHDRAIQ